MTQVLPISPLPPCTHARPLRTPHSDRVHWLWPRFSLVEQNHSCHFGGYIASISNSPIVFLYASSFLCQTQAFC